ncbi:hypothetical protein Agub_g3178 [Astrephomene gubernaculifera]|uniref:Hexosyltransferase n=1 Tax=Astrephomene gubernaculifera TaxID=47775 RepID=A0AAD3DI72_9CHLO|nr:hypothetical protein Agub_g3178 [Astrephomene gubernaculifera]
MHYARSSLSSCLLLFYLVFTIAIGRSQRTAVDGGVASNASRLLAASYNEVYEPTPTTFLSFMSGVPLSLRLGRAWWSQKSSRLPVTMFTTATMDRLDMLETQCRNYAGGPHASAVYLPLVQSNSADKLTYENEQTLLAAEARIQELFHRMEADPQACHMRVHLLYEVTSDSALAYLTPINALRNAALLAATTPLVMMIDVDLCVSRTLVQLLSSPSNTLQIMTRTDKMFWVLPAWDVSKSLAPGEVDTAATSAISGDKSNLVKLLAAGQLSWFGQSYFQRGHAPTNYTRWLLGRRSYQVGYSLGYEPWGIVRRDEMLMAPYDARFRGCYNDKITQVVSLHHARVEFRTLPNAWVVHRPHALNPAAAIGKSMLNSTTSQHGVEVLQEIASVNGRNMTKFEHHKDLSHVLMDDSIVQMLAGKYRPYPGKQFTYCRSVLPWQLPASRRAGIDIQRRS